MPEEQVLYKDQWVEIKSTEILAKKTEFSDT